MIRDLNYEKPKHRLVLTITIFLSVVYICTSQNQEEETLTSNYRTITVTKDIPYREGNSESWKSDLAMPENFGSELRPALVIIHGGGWSSGSKSVDVYQKMMVDYAHKGYVTINVDYRLTGEAGFPAAIEV